MTVATSAPSNIALIKYMGKLEGQGNQPTNSSLSWTLESLRSFVKITLQSDWQADQWQPLQGEGLLDLPLSEKSVSRFLQHFENLKTQFGIQGFFLIQSANNFPSDCGLASSASSFAALTLAATELFAKMGSAKAVELSVMDKADLSRQGSGSSCRSFFGPWALWFRNGVRPLEFPMQSLHHQVVVVESEAKLVSSSEAHRRVTSSPRFAGRPERAEERLANLIQALRSEDENLESWRRAFEICWDEFQDMHELFETSQPAFSYRTEQSRNVLSVLQDLWQEQADGPIVTMDAGANIHLLYRDDQKDLSKKLEKKFASQFKVFSSSLSSGELK
ncbi:MAG: diphosphomevalonate/mevalonate 3,5-bisphosphate decarboxylase family protein [Pseudobdellovibrionaceae bacterium]